MASELQLANSSSASKAPLCSQNPASGSPSSLARRREFHIPCIKTQSLENVVRALRTATQLNG